MKQHIRSLDIRALNIRALGVFAGLAGLGIALAAWQPAAAQDAPPSAAGPAVPGGPPPIAAEQDLMDPGEGAGPPGSDMFSNDIVVLGDVDPKVRKAMVIVNGAVITDLDIAQRLRLIEIANGRPFSQEQRERIRYQVLNNLIDEKLQIDAAAEKDLKIEDKDIEERFDIVARNFRKSPGEFSDYLKKSGTSKKTLTDQIHSEIAWSKVLRRKVEPFINVGDDEVQAIVDRIQASKGQNEFHLAEILLTANADNENTIRDRVQNLEQELRAGSSFVAYARQYSEAATAGVGGDLGWVQLAQLAPELRDVVGQMKVGDLSPPVRVSNGYMIVYLRERREIGGKDPLDTVVTAKQVRVPLPKDTSDASMKPLVDKLTRITARGGCGKTEDMARDIGGTASDVPQLRIRDLPPGLQNTVQRLQVGEATPPFATQQDIRVLVLCGKDESQAEMQGPSFDEIYAQLNEQRVSMAARRLMRDLRRDAIVDYR